MEKKKSHKIQKVTKKELKSKLLIAQSRETTSRIKPLTHWFTVTYGMALIAKDIPYPYK